MDELEAKVRLYEAIAASSKGESPESIAKRVIALLRLFQQ